MISVPSSGATSAADAPPEGKTLPPPSVPATQNPVWSGPVWFAGRFRAPPRSEPSDLQNRPVKDQKCGSGTLPNQVSQTRLPVWPAWKRRKTTFPSKAPAGFPDDSRTKCVSLKVKGQLVLQGLLMDESICVFTSVSRGAAEQLKPKQPYQTTPTAETSPPRHANVSFAYAKQSGSILVVGDVSLFR